MIETDNRRGVPMIILECTATSHPFETRSISVAETVKVGRAVAKVRPTSENAIFDCKVLSRNQALFWYSENKFYLQDTKSSNGTYVNSKKLPSESPFEVFSNDLIQFGVEISESSQKTTHNCVIARAKMVHPDGSEAIRGCVPSSAESLINAARSYDVYQIQQYMQEAVRREYILQEKLTALEKFIDETKLSVEDSWKAMINEDKLLGRICFLENQLQIYKTKFDENAMNAQVANISENFHEFEKKWKLKMKFVYEEKTAVMAKSAQFETDLLHCRQECGKLEKEVEDLKFQLKEAYEEADQRRLRIDELTNMLQTEVEIKEKKDTCDRQILCDMTSAEMDRTVHILASLLRNLSLNRREENITIDSNYIPSFQTIFENFESLIHRLCSQAKILSLPVNEIIVSELLGSTNDVISEMKRITVEFEAYNAEVLRILDSSTFCLIGRISDLEAELEERNGMEIMELPPLQTLENDDIPDFPPENDYFDEYNEIGSKDTDTDADATECNHVDFAEPSELAENCAEMKLRDSSVLLVTTDSQYRFSDIESDEGDAKTLADSMDLTERTGVNALKETCAAEITESWLATSNDSKYELDIMEQRVKLIEAELEKLQDEKNELTVKYELLLAANSELTMKNSELKVSFQSVSEKADSFAKELVEHKSRHGQLLSRYEELDSEMNCVSLIIHSASFLSKITALSLLIPASIMIYACIFLLNSF